jgi:dolichol-phosphate mannosyltransferase
MTQLKTPPRLSAIVACYKDEAAIPILYHRLTETLGRLGVEYELVFVNDGSPDNSAQLLADLASADKRVVVINHSRNFGSQGAFTSGMRVATGDAVVLLDGDLQDPPEVIEGLYQKWLEGHKVVYGVRVKREAPRLMQFAYKAFYRVFRATSYVGVPLDAGDFSLMDRQVVDALNGLPENNRFLRGMRAWVGFNQVGVPYTRPERPFGRSTNSFLRNFAWARTAILSFSYMPLDFIAWLALGVVGLATVAIVAQVISRLLFPNLAPSGFTTLIVLILFMGGIQLLCLAIIGSYLSHIYDEVKRRPPFVVESILNDPTRDAPPRRPSRGG